MLQALPVTGFHPLLTGVLDHLQVHRSWYYDGIWEPEELRREVAAAYLSDAIMGGKLWIVLDGSELCGVILLNEIRAYLDAKCHFVFWDRELRNKRQLIINLMQKVFDDEDLQLHALRVEIPANMPKFIGFIRRALGFKLEAERCLENWKDRRWHKLLNKLDLDSTTRDKLDAALSTMPNLGRRHEAFQYEGKWYDTILLSLTKEEFHSVRPQHQQSPPRDDSSKPRADRPSPTTASGHPERPVELSTASSTSRPTTAAGRADL